MTVPIKQLFNKRNGQYNPINPNSYIQGIIDNRNDKELQEYIDTIGTFIVSFDTDTQTTRCSIDVHIRKKGLQITYFNPNTNENITEYFKGNASDVTNDSIWGNDDNWELIPDKQYIENHAVIPNKSINMNKLADDVVQAIGDSGLSADEEDLTDRNGILKFKDRKYNVEEASGLGYKILRRNWVEDKNILTQEMINEANTIYEIRYDFDLNEEEITIPVGCVLKFNGGVLNNGQIVGNKTVISSPIVLIFGSELQLTGSWSIDALYPEWFGANANGESDCVEAINKAILLASTLNIYNVKLSSGTYLVYSTIYMRNGVSLRGVSSALFPYGYSGTIIYADFADTKSFVISNYAAYNDVEIGYRDTLSGAQVTDGNFTPCREFHIEDIRIQCKQRIFGGVRSIGCFGFLRRNVTISNVYYGFVTIASWNGSDENLSVTNCLYSCFFIQSDVNCVSMKNCNAVSTTDATVYDDYVYEIMTANMSYIKSYSSCLFARFAYSLYLKNFCCEGGNVGKQFLSCSSVEDHAPYTENIKEWEYTVRATTIHLYDGFHNNLTGCKGLYAHESNKIIDSGYLYNKGIEGKSNDFYYNPNVFSVPINILTLNDFIALDDNIFKNINNASLGSDTITFSGNDIVVFENRNVTIAGKSGANVEMSSGFRPKIRIINGRLYIKNIEFSITGSGTTNKLYTGIITCNGNSKVIFENCIFNLNGNSCVIDNVSAINGTSGMVTARAGSIINVAFRGCTFNGTGTIVNQNCKVNSLSLNNCSLNDTVLIGGSVDSVYEDY